MQIVINICKEDIEEICMQARMVEDTGSLFGRIRKAISHGTPLPKGHGRLIDENKLLENLEESANHHANNSREESLLYRNRVIVREQPTIIEADRSEDGEEE